MRRAIAVWFALLGGIGAWAVHLIVLASLTRASCSAPAVRLAMHATTVGCAGVALTAIWLAHRLTRQRCAKPPDPLPGGASLLRSTRFIGQVGLIVGIVNLALILFEEIDLITLTGRACG